MFITVINKKKARNFAEREKLAMLEVKQVKDSAVIGERSTHKMVCDITGVMDRKSENILYYKPYYGNDCLFIQSERPIVKEAAEKYGYDIEAEVNGNDLLDSIHDGDYLFFKGKLAPTKSVKREDGKERKISIGNKDERMNWVCRRLKNAGAEVLNAEGLRVEELSTEKIEWRHADNPGQAGSVYAHIYSGYLHITNADLFKETVKTGLGRNKAYGCGMLLLKHTGRNG